MGIYVYITDICVESIIIAILNISGTRDKPPDVRILYRKKFLARWLHFFRGVASETPSSPLFPAAKFIKIAITGSIVTELPRSTLKVQTFVFQDQNNEIIQSSTRPDIVTFISTPIRVNDRRSLHSPARTQDNTDISRKNSLHRFWLMRNDVKTSTRNARTERNWNYVSAYYRNVGAMQRRTPEYLLLPLPFLPLRTAITNLSPFVSVIPVSRYAPTHASSYPRLLSQIPNARRMIVYPRIRSYTAVCIYTSYIITPDGASTSRTSSKAPATPCIYSILSIMSPWCIRICGVCTHSPRARAWRKRILKVHLRRLIWPKRAKLLCTQWRAAERND